MPDGLTRVPLPLSLSTYIISKHVYMYICITCSLKCLFLLVKKHTDIFFMLLQPFLITGYQVDFGCSVTLLEHIFQV